jgi:hypothetical protein
MKNCKAIVISMFMVALSMSAQASGSHDLPFTAQTQYSEMRINWIVSKDIVQTCNMLFALSSKGQAKYNNRIVACATRSKSAGTCDIYTAENLTLAVLGHEIRHCFEGAWHE